MHGAAWTNRQIEAKRERGRRMANVRWEMERARRDRLAQQAATDPLRCVTPERKILQRIVVINLESQAMEIIRWSGMSQREWSRLKRSVGL